MLRKIKIFPLKSVFPPETLKAGYGPGSAKIVSAIRILRFEGHTVPRCSITFLQITITGAPVSIWGGRVGLIRHCPWQTCRNRLSLEQSLVRAFRIRTRARRSPQINVLIGQIKVLHVVRAFHVVMHQTTSRTSECFNGEHLPFLNRSTDVVSEVNISPHGQITSSHKMRWKLREAKKKSPSKLTSHVA